MRVCLDENMPLPIRSVLDGHEVSSVREQGWSGKSNGELLDLVEADFDVLVTSDGSIQHQQNLIRRNVSILVVPTNNLTRLLANAIAVRVTLDELVTSLWRTRRAIRGLTHADDETRGS
jgi:predicted nuclease of predicted toxin-antitoxin system